MEGPQKTKIELSYDPEIPLPAIYPKDMKTLTWKDICPPIFIAALFSIAKMWKQPKCISVDEWVKINVAYTCNGILYSHKKE